MIALKIALILGLVYLGLGLVFAILFLSRGLQKVDPAAHGSGWGFRLIILPGTVALWPLLLNRWMKVKNNKP